MTRSRKLSLCTVGNAGDVAEQQKFDVVFDISGNRPMAGYRRVMTLRGILVAVGGPAGDWFAPADRMLRRSHFTAQS